MPRVERDPPRAVPIRLLRPGSPFLMPPPIGTVAGGLFLELIGHDAKVLPDGASAAVCWSGETMVLRDGERPLVAVPQPKKPAPSGPSRAEKREARVRVERVMARPAAPPSKSISFVGQEG